MYILFSQNINFVFHFWSNNIVLSYFFHLPWWWGTCGDGERVVVIVMVNEVWWSLCRVVVIVMVNELWWTSISKKFSWGREEKICVMLQDEKRIQVLLSKTREVKLQDNRKKVKRTDVYSFLTRERMDAYIYRVSRQREKTSDKSTYYIEFWTIKHST